MSKKELGHIAGKDSQELVVFTTKNKFEHSVL
jgi:hypothetical protein